MKRFVIRTIKNGKVTINGIEFYPDTRYMQYDGRLDGMRYAFGLYYIGKEWDKSMAFLWGTEEAYRTFDENGFPGPETIEDGGMPWMWWFSESPKQWNT